MAVTMLVMPPKSKKPKSEQPPIYIKCRRERKGMTLEELGVEMDVDKGTVSRWEARKRYPDNATIKQLAGVFGCKFEDMFHPLSALSSTNTTSSRMQIDIATLAAEVAKHLDKPRRR